MVWQLLERWQVAVIESPRPDMNLTRFFKVKNAATQYLNTPMTFAVLDLGRVRKGMFKPFVPIVDESRAMNASEVLRGITQHACSLV
jgi:hypothetical protein